jgi:hypothetical protein
MLVYSLDARNRSVHVCHLLSAEHIVQLQFEVGLKYAHELVDDGKELPLLVHRDDVMEKLHFDSADIIAVSVVIDDERRSHKSK